MFIHISARLHVGAAEADSLGLLPAEDGRRRGGGQRLQRRNPGPQDRPCAWVASAGSVGNCGGLGEVCVQLTRAGMGRGCTRESCDG